MPLKNIWSFNLIIYVSSFIFGGYFLDLIFFSVFGIYYVVHGVLQERATEIIIYSVANFAVLMYLIVNYAAGSKDDIKLVWC